MIHPWGFHLPLFATKLLWHIENISVWEDVVERARVLLTLLIIEALPVELFHDVAIYLNHLDKILEEVEMEDVGLL